MNTSLTIYFHFILRVTVECKFDSIYFYFILRVTVEYKFDYIFLLYSEGGR